MLGGMFRGDVGGCRSYIMEGGLRGVQEEVFGGVKGV